MPGYLTPVTQLMGVVLLCLGDDVLSVCSGREFVSELAQPAWLPCFQQCSAHWWWLKIYLVCVCVCVCINILTHTNRRRGLLQLGSPSVIGRKLGNAVSDCSCLDSAPFCLRLWLKIRQGPCGRIQHFMHMCMQKQRCSGKAGISQVPSV